MKCNHRLWPRAALCAPLFLISINSAHAYIDPGTGSYLFQCAVAALVGAGYVVRMKWQHIRGLVAGLMRRGGNGPESGDAR